MTRRVIVRTLVISFFIISHYVNSYLVRVVREGGPDILIPYSAILSGLSYIVLGIYLLFNHYYADVDWHIYRREPSGPWPANLFYIGMIVLGIISFISGFHALRTGVI